MNKFIKYLIESIDDEDFFSDLGYDTGKEMTFLVDDSLYVYHPQSKEELRLCILKHFDNNITDLNDIDVSKITDMKELFNSIYYNLDNFSELKENGTVVMPNVDVSGWDMSNVTDASAMFYFNPNFDCDLSEWNVSNITNFSKMFANCKNFKGTGLSKWNINKKQNDLSFMFFGCINFVENLSCWKVPRAIYKYKAFCIMPKYFRYPSWFLKSDR